MRKRRMIALLVGALFLGVAFQNCAPAQLVFEDVQKSEEAAFFDYPYKESPKFYGNVLLFQKESGVANLSDFTFVGTASYLPNPASTIDYTIKIVDADKPTEIICAQEDGSLTAGLSTITFKCVTGKTFKTMKILMSLKVGSTTTTIEKLYQK